MTFEVYFGSLEWPCTSLWKPRVASYFPLAALGYPLVPFWLSGVAVDFILEALEDPLISCWLSGVALDLILEALGDMLGMGWVPDWPGVARTGRMALAPRRGHCFTRIQGSG